MAALPGTAAYEEQVWSSAVDAQMLGGIHDNTIMYYFGASPFFDRTSNNAILINQAQYSGKPSELDTRAKFDAQLRSMQGLEFVVAEGPADPVNGTGVWVIRKQTRKKIPGEEDGITVHATYFVVNGNIYMAPSVADVLGSNMLTILSSMNNFISSAAALPTFNPALGHTYMPPPKSSRLRAPESQLTRQSAPLTEAFQKPKDHNASTPFSDNQAYLDAQVLTKSIEVMMAYGDEYMDENPIMGEPGAFSFSNTGRTVEPVAPVAPKAQGMLGKTPTPTPPALKTDIPPDRKGSKTPTPKTPGMPKPKRRKSKALSASGGSPKN